MVAYSSTQSGLFDDVNTWGGGGFPGATDTFTVNNTHVVTVKGTEQSSTYTINAGGVLEFDGQGDTVPAILQIQPNTSNINNGTVRETGTGSTGYASITSQNPATQWVFLLNTPPEWGTGYWKLGRLYIAAPGIITESIGATIELVQSYFWVEGDFIIGLNDTFISNDAEIILEAFNLFLQGEKGFRVYLLGDFQEGTSHIFFEDDVITPFDTDLYVADGNRLHDVTVNAGHIVNASQRVLVEGSLIGSITLSGISDELISINDLVVTGTLNAANTEISLVVKDKEEVVRRIRNE